jgi:starch synthase
VKDFISAMQRAMVSFNNKEAWSRLQINGMNQDFSWTNSALKYLELYKRLISHTRVPLP